MTVNWITRKLEALTALPPDCCWYKEPEEEYDWCDCGGAGRFGGVGRSGAACGVYDGCCGCPYDGWLWPTPRWKFTAAVAAYATLYATKQRRI